MKRIIIAFIVATLALSYQVNAQQTNAVSKSETEFEILKDQYQKLVNQQVELEKERAQITTELKEERKNHQDFVEGIYKWIAVFISAVVAILGFFGWKEYKKALADIERKTTEAIRKESERLETDAKEKLQSLTNQLILDVSRLINRNPDSIKEMIDRKIYDYDVKQNNPICLYHTAEDGVDEQLKAYDYNIIESYEINSDDEPSQYISYKDASVVFIANPYSEENSANSFCTNLDNKVKSDVNYFYLGAGRFDSNNKVQFKNFANTPITVEHNLLDLLRYIEYKKHD